MRGFTLIELVITVGVAALLMGALATTFVLFSSLSRFEVAGAGTGGEAGVAMRAFDAAILPADQVLATHTFSGSSYASGTSTLVLEIPSVDSAGSVLSTTYDYVAFYKASSTLYERVETGAGSARRAGLFTLGTRVRALGFTYDSADYTAVTTVTTDVVASTTIKGQDAALHLTQTERLRNR